MLSRTFNSVKTLLVALLLLLRFLALVVRFYLAVEYPPLDIYKPAGYASILTAWKRSGLPGVEIRDSEGLYSHLVMRWDGAHNGGKAVARRKGVKVKPLICAAGAAIPVLSPRYPWG